jgi:Zn-dependent peptidase ImmA (M78 family)
MNILNLDRLPKIYFVGHLQHDVQPSFGEYREGEKILTIALKNRHPNDILRTVAHELVHFKQDLDGNLKDPNSGATGSPQENEANAVAGIIMRNFNKKYPQYISNTPI